MATARLRSYITTERRVPLASECNGMISQTPGRKPCFAVIASPKWNVKPKVYNRKKAQSVQVIYVVRQRNGTRYIKNS